MLFRQLFHRFRSQTRPSRLTRRYLRGGVRRRSRRDSSSCRVGATERLEDRTLLTAGLADADDNGVAAPLSDGILMLRRFAGFGGGSLIDSAVANDGFRKTAINIAAHIDSNMSQFDVDANGETTALTDGLTLIRALAGFTGNSLVDGAIDITGDRTDPVEVLDYIRDLFPDLLVTQVSPTHGEQMVNVTRDVIVQFDAKLNANSITDDAFHLIAQGERVPGRIAVSSTDRFVRFIPDEPLPPQTEVRIVIDGDRILNQNGVKLDANRSGVPGGNLNIDYSTLPLARIEGTDVFGFVRDARTQEPIVGATIRVDAFPDANAVTDSTGRFLLQDMPAPEFFVHIDGSTATNTPAGFQYPNVGKPFHSVPGQQVQLNHNGTVFDVFLPPLAVNDIQTLSATAPTELGFGIEGKAELQTMFPGLPAATWDRLRVNVAPGSVIDDLGNPVTQAAIIPVPPERLPAPLPPNFDPQLVISIQAFGATSFDVPAPINFPNLDGLEPGSKATLFSFNHDVGEFQPIGLGTVSEDGTTIVSDPGVGVVAPGWHFSSPPLTWVGGTESEGNEKNDEDQDEVIPEVSARLLVSGQTDELSFTFTPPPAGNNGTTGSGDGHPTPGGEKSTATPTRVVTISVADEADFNLMYDTPPGDEGIRSTTFEIKAGQAPRTIQASLRSLQDFLTRVNEQQLRDSGGDPSTAKPLGLFQDALYGAQITIEEEVTLSDGSKQRTKRIVIPYLLVDQSDDNFEDGVLKLADTVIPGDLTFERRMEVHSGGAPTPTFVFNGADPDDFFKSTRGISFEPKVQTGPITARDPRSATLQLQIMIDTDGDGTAEPFNASGSVQVTGDGTAIQQLLVNRTQLKTALDAINVQHVRKVTYDAGSADETYKIRLSANGDTTDEIRFDADAAAIQASIAAKLPGDPVTVREVGVPETVDGTTTRLFEIEWVNGMDGSADLLSGFPIQDSTATGRTWNSVTRDEWLLFDTDGKRESIADGVFDQITQLMSGHSAGISVVDTTDWPAPNLDPGNPNVISIDWERANKRGRLGTSAPDGIDAATDIAAAINDHKTDRQVVRNFVLDEAINQDFTTTVKTFVDTPLERSGDNLPLGNSDQERLAFVNTLAKSATHEAGHSLGGRHTHRGNYEVTTTNDAGQAVNGRDDIMKQGLDFAGSLRFLESQSANLLDLALNLGWTKSDGALTWLNFMSHFGQRSTEEKMIGFDVDRDDPDLTTPPIEEESLPTPVVGPALFVNPVTLDGFGDAGDTNLYVLGDPELTPSSAGLSNMQSFDFFNFGTEDVVITNPTMNDPSGSFTFAGIPAGGLTLEPGGSQRLDVVFDFDGTPTTPESIFAEFSFDSNDPILPTTTIGLTGLAPTPAAFASYAFNNSVEAAVTSSQRTNNVGDVVVYEMQISSLLVRNTGGSGLEVTLSIDHGGEHFILGNPVDLATGEVVQGETFVIPPVVGQFLFPVTVSPMFPGLFRGTIGLTTNDPTQPVVQQGFVGTGTPEGGIGSADRDWGNDFVLVEYNDFVQRTTSNALGDFMLEVPIDTPYTVSVFDPDSGFLMSHEGVTRGAGQFTDVTRFGEFRASTAPDLDFDGLPADIEMIIGTDDNNPDTDNDGDNDFVEISNKTNPLDGFIQTIGIIANLPTRGSAVDVDVQVDQLSGRQLVYVATDFGLEIFDTTNPQLPIALGRIAAPGAVGVAVDGDTAIVARGSAGFDRVNIADPMLPTIIAPTVTAFAVQHAEIRQGHAFLAGQGILVHSLDTGAELGNITLPGTGTVSGMARNGDLLFAYKSGADTLFVIDIGIPDQAEILSQLNVAIASQTVGVGISQNTVHLFGSGLRNVDVRDPQRPFLAGFPTGGEFFTARGGAGDGSGRVLIAQEHQGAGLFDINDRADTARVLAQFDTPGFARAVDVIGGLGFVADSAAGVQVINYLQRDNAGQAPTVTLQTPADADPNTPGLQVVEGSAIDFSVDVQDDVLVRSVELLIDNQVVSTDIAFPFDGLPEIGGFLGNGQVAIQARATDTGGNVGVSDTIFVELVPDTFAPRVEMVSPGNNDFIPTTSVFTTFDFTESVNPTTLDASGFTLVRASDQQIFTATDLRFSRNNRIVDILFADLGAAGEYNFQTNLSAVQDVAGNAMSDTPIDLSYTAIVADTVFTNPAGGSFNDLANWSNGVPGPGDSGFILPSSAVVTVTSTVNAATLFNRANFVVENSRTIASHLTNGPTGVIDLKPLGAGLLLTVQDADLHNYGKIRITEGPTRASTVLDIQGNATLFNMTGGTVETFPGGGGESVLEGDVVNHGTFDLQGGLTYRGSNITFTHGPGAVFSDSSDLTIQNAEFVQDGGTFGGSQIVLINGTFTVMTDFTMPEDMAITASVRSEINGPGELTVGPDALMDIIESVVSAPIVNQGTVLTRGARIFFDGPIINQAGGTFSVRGTPDSNNGFVTIEQGFTNRGLFELRSTLIDPDGFIGQSVDLSIVELPFINEAEGTFSIPAGVGQNPERSIHGALDNRGTFNVLHDTRFRTALGSNQPVSITNSGTIHIDDNRVLTQNRGSFTHDGGTFATNELVLDGVALVLSTDLTIPDDMTLRIIGSTSLVTGVGKLTISDNALLEIRDVTIETDVINHGHIIARTGRPEISGALINEFFGRVTIEGTNSTNDGILKLIGGGSNKGVIELTSTQTNPASSLGDNVTLIISGDPLVNMDTGTIIAEPTIGLAPLTRIQGNLANLGGILDINTNTNFESVAPDRGMLNNVSSTIDIAAGAQLLISRADLVLNGTTLIGNRLVLDQAELALTTDLTIPAEFTLIVSNAAEVNSDEGSTLTIAENANFGLIAGIVNVDLMNHGTTTLERFSALNAAITNSPLGTILVTGTELTGDATVTVSSGLTNQGRLELTTTIDPGSQSGIGDRASLTVTGGDLVNEPSGVIVSRGGGGIAPFRSITGNIDNQGDLLVDFALFVLGAGTGNVTNSGFVGVHGGQTLEVSGDFTQTATGVLGINIGGGSAGEFGIVAITGDASLGGELDANFVDGFVPVLGATFEVLTFADRGATEFSAINVMGDGIEVDGFYDINDLTLEVTAVPGGPVAGPLPGFSSGGATNYAPLVNRPRRIISTHLDELFIDDNWLGTLLDGILSSTRKIAL